MLPAAVFAEDTGGSGMVAEMGGTDADKTHAVASGEFTVTPLRLSGGGGSTSGRFTVEFGANGGSGGTSGRFTVEFGANGGSNVASQTVPRNAAIKEPTAPTKEDFDFSGWYTDKELKTEYDFTAKVTSGFAFCAAWTEKEKIGKSDNPHHRREGRVRFRSIENKRRRAEDSKRPHNALCKVCGGESGRKG